MTKRELIDFLAPFTDDLIIVGYSEEFSHNENDGLHEIYPVYKSSKNSIPELRIKFLDGIVVLK